MADELQPMLVQEIAKRCKNDIPENFVHKNGYPQAKLESVPYMDDMIIDLSVLSASASSSELENELHKLKLALNKWGCFQAIHHGLTDKFIEKVQDVTKQFSALPLEEKQRYSIPIDGSDGYGRGAYASEQQPHNWLDSLRLTVYPEDQRKLSYWPEKPLEFREVLNEYTMKVQMMYELLMKSMACCLNLEESSFLKEHGNVNMSVRFNIYPSCPSPECVLGASAHADGSTITVLLPDREGLQILKDDQWFKVPIVANALFINGGDILEVMSNGLLKSPVHRVVTNSELERTSVAMFCSADPDREIGPVVELITEERPQKFKKVKRYGDIFYESYRQGKRPLDALRIY